MDNIIGIKEASELLGVSVATLRNWDKNNKLKSIKTKGNHRRYKKNDIIAILNKNDNFNDNLSKNKIVVYTYICGDILHKGHLEFLKNAASLGNFLIVGVLTNEAIMEKKKVPIIDFNERIELVKYLKMVDMAVPQYQYSPYVNIKNFKPDILVESTSHSKEIIKKSKESMRKIGGKVIIHPYYPNQSSSQIKFKIEKGS